MFFLKRFESIQCFRHFLCEIFWYVTLDIMSTDKNWITLFEIQWNILITIDSLYVKTTSNAFTEHYPLLWAIIKIFFSSYYKRKSNIPDFIGIIPCLLTAASFIKANVGRKQKVYSNIKEKHFARYNQRWKLHLFIWLSKLAHKHRHVSLVYDITTAQETIIIWYTIYLLYMQLTVHYGTLCLRDENIIP